MKEKEIRLFSNGEAFLQELAEVLVNHSNNSFSVIHSNGKLIVNWEQPSLTVNFCVVNVERPITKESILEALKSLDNISF